MNEKKNIAVVWGGYTSEIVVSEKSMHGICSFLDTSRYNIYPVKIDRQTWTVVSDNKIYEIDKNDFSFSVSDKKINIDFAYITIHGSPGEDGKLQGYFDIIGMPYSACGVTAAAVTMNKYICNKYLKNFGIESAESFLLRNNEKEKIICLSGELDYPVFVKPNLGGSSFATNKVKSSDEFMVAVEAAFGEAEEVIIENFIKGREVTCGCYKVKDKKTVLPLTEVVTGNDFFDYDAKYNGQVEEITPAQIDEEITADIQRKTMQIYDLVGAKGIIRADFIIKGNIPYLLEVNTTPGMTETSFIPQQIKAAGLNITDVLTLIIENELNK